MYHTSTGQVLGASTAVGGIMSLPQTGDYLPALILSYLAITVGVATLLTFIVTRIIRHTLAK